MTHSRVGRGGRDSVQSDMVDNVCSNDLHIFTSNLGVYFMSQLDQIIFIFISPRSNYSPLYAIIGNLDMYTVYDRMRHP